MVINLFCWSQSSAYHSLNSYTLFLPSSQTWHKCKMREYILICHSNNCRLICKVTWSLMQILAGNARKVSAVRFERINNDEAKLDAKEVTRMVPKIMKRKWSSDDELDHTEDDYTYSKKPEDHTHVASVISEHEDDNDS